MIKITNVTIKNFLSVGAATQAIKLNEHGLTLVLGANTDNNGGTTRNGAGKSTMLQAVSFGLFGKPLTRIKIPNLINNINGKGMLVTVEFERDGKRYRIERGKKPDVMRLFSNDEELKTETDDAQGENRHTQEEIERLLGMSHTMFKHIVALNTFTDPFLKMSVADQRMVIEELLGIMQISQRADVLKKLVSQTKENIRDQQATINATAEANARIENAINQALMKFNAWSKSNEEKIKSLADDLAMMESMDFEAELAILDALDAYLENERVLTQTLDMAKRELALMDRELQALVQDCYRIRDESKRGVEAQVSQLQADHDRKLSFAKRHEAAKTKLLAEMQAVENDLASSDSSECVCCGQRLEGTDHLKTVVANLEKKKSELVAKIEIEDRDAAHLREDATSILAEIEKVRAEDESRQLVLKNDMAAKDQEIEALQATRMIKEEAIVIAMEGLSSLGDRPVSTFKSRDDVYQTKQARDAIERELQTEMGAKNPYEHQLEDLRAAIQEINYEPINELTDLLKHQEFLLKLLTGKDSFIRKRIIDQNLSYLNSRLNFYLDKLGLPHEVQFQSDLSVNITLLGRDFDFEQLSRGEMNRVIMATSWSFRDVWESMNTSINLIWLDELIDSGMDGSGAEAALGILKSMARDRGKNVFLISHREELVGRIDRTLWVRKENGFTTLDQDESHS